MQPTTVWRLRIPASLTPTSLLASRRVLAPKGVRRPTLPYFRFAEVMFWLIEISGIIAEAPTKLLR